MTATTRPRREAEDIDLAQAVRHRRTRLHLVQRDVYEALDMDPMVYSRIENGSRPLRASELMRVAAVLDTTADDLIASARKFARSRVRSERRTAAKAQSEPAPDED